MDESGLTKRLEVSLTHTNGEPHIYLRGKRPDAVQLLGDTMAALRANDDGQDTHINGLVKDGRFYATSVLEGPPGGLRMLGALDFMVFCKALSIPYIEPTL